MVRTGHLLLLAPILAGVLNAGQIGTNSFPLHFETTPDGRAYVARMGASRVRLSADAADFGEIQLRLIGGQHSQPAGAEKLAASSNYFVGSDPSKWRAGVEQFARVRYNAVYPGVDLVYHGDDRRIEYDFEVAAHANPADIRIAFENAGRLRVGSGGSLDAGALKFARPVARQSGREVAVRYVVAKNEVRFRLGPYDHSQPLVIDPSLVFSTYLGGSEFDFIDSLAVDTAGNEYVAGYTNSLDFPVVGGLQKQCGNGSGGCQNVFIAKFSPTGSLVYSTYLGGSHNTGSDSPSRIVVDSTGAVYVTGDTSSPDFPTTASALLTSMPSNTSLGGTAFVTKLNPAGSALVYSTYLGGSSTSGSFGTNHATDMAVDSAGNAYVVGYFSQMSYPLVNPIQVTVGTTPPGFPETCFISELNATGSALLFSTYLGGTNQQQASGVALDSAGSIYVTGFTASPDFPLLNAYQSTQRGKDAFVTKISSSYKLVYSTLLGGSMDDGGSRITVDSTGAAYLIGGTASPDFPLVNPAQTLPLPTSNFSQGFVAKLAPSGSSLLYSTFLGGSRNTGLGGIALDAAGDIWVGGGTDSFDFPVVNPFQSAKGGIAPYEFGGNAIIVEYSPGGQILYATYFGSNYDDGGGIALAPNGDVVLAGQTSSTDFPIFNAYQSKDNDAGITSVPGQASFVTRFTQAAAPCVYTLFPNKTAFYGAGDNGVLRVNVNSSTCTWTATDSDSWISFSSGASTTGIGNVVYTVAPNPGYSARTSTILAAGQSVQLTQGVPTHFAPAAGAGGLPGGLARVPVSLVADPLLIYNNVMLTVNVTPNGSAPALTAPLSFQVAPNLPPPQVTVSTSSITVSWSAQEVPPFTNTVPLGKLLISIPAGATAGQSYSVQPSGSAVPTIPGPVDAGGPAVTVTVGSPLPAITWMIPSSAAPGSAGLTITVNGEGFTAASTVLWNGSPRVTTFKSETQVQAAITAADLAAAGTAQLTANNPAPNGGTSAAAVFVITAAPAPSVNVKGIVNAASYQTLLAGNTIASLFGTNLAGSTASALVIPLPMSLGGVSVLVDGTPAPLFYVSPTQINFQMPWRLLNQTQTAIAVVSGGASSGAAMVSLTPVGPSIFTLNSQGSGQGAILFSSVNTFVAPAGSVPGSQAQPGMAGSGISVYCTGLGAVNSGTFAFSDGGASNGADKITGNATVTIGGVNAPVSYAGVGPGFVGLYQVNVTIPSGTVSGSAIPVVLTVNGIASNTVTIAVQ